MSYVWVDDDDNVGLYNEEIIGNTEILGESLRGLQNQMAMLGAPPKRKPAAGSALARLSQQAAMQRATRYAPMQRTLPSQYKDSTQFGVRITGTIAVGSWTATGPLPQLSARTRIYASFKPEKAILTEQLIATYTNASGVSAQVAASVGDAGDLYVVAAYVGNYNCFPTAPDQTTGISGPSLANVSLGNGISWPTVNGGIDLTATVAVERTAQFRFTPPSGYTSSQLVSVEVIAVMNFFGQQLR